MLGLPSKRIFVLELTNSIFVAFLKKNQDPNTNKIKQILGARDSTGVITNFLEVDTQPVLGDWKIKVMAHVSHYFIDVDILIYRNIILILWYVSAFYLRGNPPRRRLQLPTTVRIIFPEIIWAKETSDNVSKCTKNRFKKILMKLKLK